MPGIDFNKLRQEITMEEVLNLLDFEPTQRSIWKKIYAVEDCIVHPAIIKLYNFPMMTKVIWQLMIKAVFSVTSRMRGLVKR